MRKTRSVLKKKQRKLKKKRVVVGYLHAMTQILG